MYRKWRVIHLIFSLFDSNLFFTKMFYTLFSEPHTFIHIRSDPHTPEDRNWIPFSYDFNRFIYSRKINFFNRILCACCKFFFGISKGKQLWIWTKWSNIFWNHILEYVQWIDEFCLRMRYQIVYACCPASWLPSKWF